MVRLAALLRSFRNWLSDRHRLTTLSIDKSDFDRDPDFDYRAHISTSGKPAPSKKRSSDAEILIIIGYLDPERDKLNPR